MSTTYPALTETNFPDSIDTMSRMSDLNASDVAAVAQYYSYYNAGNMTAAAQVITDNALDNKIFNAEKFNKLIDALVAMQRFFKSDAYAYKGAYNSSESYLVGNIVFDSEYGCAYICQKACKGVRPTQNASSENWGLIALRGATGPQGEPGTGANPSNSDPEMNGSASSGTSAAWSRSDHVHPSDTTKSDVGHKHTADDITGGAVSVTHGGTGATELADGGLLKSNGNDAVGTVLGVGALYSETSGSPKFGTLSVPMGGTGAATFANGGIVKSAGTGAMTSIVGVGALYASEEGAPKFGTLPVNAGGTGLKTLPKYSVLIGNETAIQPTASTKGAFYSNGENTWPAFGTLPIGCGGTGAQDKASARTALGFTSGIQLPSSLPVGDVFFLFK